MPARRRRPRQDRAKATVEAILQASTYILKKHGYEALTTNRIADKAGVNIASLYQYFPNKEAIFVELMRRHAETSRRRAAAVVADSKGKSLASAVGRLIDGMVASHAVEPELHRIFTAEGARMRLPDFVTDSDRELAEAGATWAQTTKRPNAELALWMTHTAVHAIVHAACAERPDIAQSPELRAELTKLVVRFLK